MLQLLRRWDFRFATTMNEDASTYEVPEYIHSRLMPQIMIDFPDEDDERAITAQARFRQIAGRAGLAVISSAILAVTLVFREETAVGAVTLDVAGDVAFLPKKVSISPCTAAPNISTAIRISWPVRSSAGSSC